MPSEPRLDESESITPPDSTLAKLSCHGLESPTSSPGFISRGLLTPRNLGQTGEKSPALSEASSPPISDPQGITDGHDAQSITVHQFLQDFTKKPCRKYGRRNRFPAVELDVHCSEGSSASPISCSDDDEGTTTHHVHLRHTSKCRVPRSRQKYFAKPLAQRLFEADVFSSGAFTQPTAQDSAHTSTRRPLQFITSLNMSPSLETRIYQRRQVVAGGSSSKRTSAVCDFLSATVTPGGALDTQGTRKGGSPGAFLSSRKRVLRARGREQGLARFSAGPFEFVPLPLVRVKTHQGAVQPQDPVIRSRLAHIQNAKTNLIHVRQRNP